MKVVVYGPYAAWSPHFETELEIMQSHLDQGDDVTFISCDRVLSFCEVNPKHEFLKCLYCQAKAECGLSQLSDRVKVIPISKLAQKAKAKFEYNYTIPSEFSTYKELYAYKVDNLDAGAAVLSSLNSYVNIPEPNPAHYAEFVNKALRSCIASYYALDLFFQSNQVDKFYLFNGRMSNLRSAVRACERNHVDFAVHERGADINRYDLTPNTLPHDLEYIKQNVFRVNSEAENPQEVAEVARQFYTSRRAGTIANWFSFTEQQKKGHVPENWNSETSKIAIYMSTETEFSALDDYYKYPLYQNQKERLFAVLKQLEKRNFNGVIAVRFHPNSKNTPCDYSGEVNQWGFPFAKAIPSHESIDSYALMESADKILTFGSTIGIEAVYWDKPSILMGRASFEHLNSTYNPVSIEQAVDFLLDPNLKPLSKDGAIIFGYFSLRFGRPFLWTHADAPLTCTFKGKRIRPQGWRRVVHKWLPRIPSLLKWVERCEAERLASISIQ